MVTLESLGKEYSSNIFKILNKPDKNRSEMNVTLTPLLIRERFISDWSLPKVDLGFGFQKCFDGGLQGRGQNVGKKPVDVIYGWYLSSHSPFSSSPSSPPPPPALLVGVFPVQLFFRNPVNFTFLI